MSKRRSFSAEEKLNIVREGMRDGTKVSKVCRRHDIYSSQYYDWKEKATLGAKEGLKPKKNGKSKGLKRKDEKLSKLKEIVADLKVENETLKKKRHLGLSGNLSNERFDKNTKGARRH